MFINTAYADAVNHGAVSSAIYNMVPLLSIIVIFYFLLIRPQQKKLREHKNMIASIKKGSKIVSSGGVLATVQKVEDDILIVEIAPEIKIKIKRDTVAELLGSEN